MFSTPSGAALLVAALIAALFSPTSARAQAPEGIKVHGRWTIEVRNADGTLASRHEFDNALVRSVGDGALIGLLGRTRTVHSWRIGMKGANDGPDGPCGPPQGLFGPNIHLYSCRLIERLVGGAPDVGELTVTADTGISSPRLILSGVARATSTIPIASVWTLTLLCTNGPDCAQGSALYQFTAHQLPTPINVAPDQLIQVTVVITFS